jgi:hydrogenase-4 transcriptional activator
MSRKILIVEDESLVAYDLELILIKAGYEVCGIADSVAEALEIIELKNPDIVLVDIFLKGSLTGIDLGKKLTERNIAFIYLSANYQESVLEKAKTTQPYGFLVKPFRENELLVMMEVVIYRHQNSMEAKIRQEQVLENSFRSTTSETLDWKQKLLKIVKSLQPYVPFDYLNMYSGNEEPHPLNGLTLLRTGFDKYDLLGREDILKMPDISAGNLEALKSKTTVSAKTGFFNVKEWHELCVKCGVRKAMAEVFQLQSFLYLPVLTSEGNILHFTFYSRKAEGYLADHLKLLSRLNHSLILAIEGIVPAKTFSQPLNKGNMTDASVKSRNKPSVFDEIVGDNHQMLTILDHVTIAAPIDTSVLILGESGTGKERIARSIHQLSPRRDNPLIIINCASLPVNLIESELFGHEKGSFTGATEKRKGKFELADKGTIFLDEIGEMPLELQVKLLRVLQEQEIERIGGSATIKINVRIIAATNRDLEHEVREGKFRLDLYYRLCVFPILMPPLRDRTDDIPKLAAHFIEKYALKFGKDVTGLSPDTLNYLMSYHWPGNIRELENFIERGVLLSKGQLITNGTGTYESKQLRPGADKPEETSSVKTIEENTREHILAVLKKCNGRISGSGGAAEHLGLPATTLHSKIKKLGLKKWD